MKGEPLRPPNSAHLAKRFLPSSSTLFQELDGETVLLNTKTGRYYGLDEVGNRTWLLIAEHGHLRTVYDTLLAEYAVAGDRLLDDLGELVLRLMTAGLLGQEGCWRQGLCIHSGYLN